MIPDTSVYMIAGFTAILGGIGVYIVSLVLRYIKLRKQAGMLEDLEEN